MQFYSIWFYFAEMSLVFLLASTMLLSGADKPPTNATVRVNTLDGLRGFLALGVFFSHGALYHHFIMNGEWKLPPSFFYVDVGEAGVQLFFMITGYLFWSQALGVQGELNFLKLYCGRVFRIVPLYLVLAAIVLITVGFKTGWQLRVPPQDLAQEVFLWLAGGALLAKDVNGLAHTFVISAGVTWTLHFEWLFYVSLLVTSVFARKRILGLLLPLIGMVFVGPVLLHHMHNTRPLVVLMFCIGMLSASIKSRFRQFLISIPQWARSVIASLFLMLPFFLFGGFYTPCPILLLGVAFIFIVQDTTLFGLLLTKPAKRLGDISYGLYLLQGPVLFAAFSASSRVRSLAAQDVWVHWLVVLVAAVALVLIATAAHVLIELPGVRLGQRIYLKIASRRPTAVAASSTV